MSKKGKHPATFITKVFMGQQEAWIKSTCKQTIFTLDPSIWESYGKNILVEEHSEELSGFSDI